MLLSRDAIELSAAKCAIEYDSFKTFLSQAESRRSLNSEESDDADETEYNR